MKKVIISLGNGSLGEGLSTVTVELWREGASEAIIRSTVSLPPATELAELQNHWQTNYQGFYQDETCRLEVEDEDTGNSNFSTAQFQEVCQQLTQQLNNWLNCQSFSRINDILRTNLDPKEEIRLIIASQDRQIRQLPWHQWQFLEDYLKAEVAFCSLNFAQPPQNVTKPSHSQVKILAIIGYSPDIDTEADCRVLQDLPHTEVQLLLEPSRQELNEQLWAQSWDILFFAGHSETQGTKGYLQLNLQESLSLDELRYGLRKAIERGLKLAIFNSCDGLGLVEALEQLHIPQMIVMRESVPDLVAQEFFQRFVVNFARGESFYQSVREARESLQGLESQFPCASWLPVICQNPAAVPLRWKNLYQEPVLLVPKVIIEPQRKLYQALLLGAIVSCLIVGLRWLGFLQTMELQAFDNLLQLRPPEDGDKRILIVGANEQDIRNYGHPLPDKILAQLLAKLQQYQPTAIGLDIVRNISVEPGHQEFVQQLKQNQDLIAICALGSNQEESIDPPTHIAPKQVGFADLYYDPQDYKVRRYLLYRTPNSIAVASTCHQQTKAAFAALLAHQYLSKKVTPFYISRQNLQFGYTLTQPLQTRSGGYQKLDARGHQLLINYRNSEQIAQEVTVTDILNDSDKFNPDWVKGRVVLIGVTAPSVPDNYLTPYGKMRGLHIHAHALSQLLSTAEEQRPLLWYWHPWFETVWIMGWSLTGGLMVWLFKRTTPQVLAGSTTVVVLFLCCFTFIIIGGWLPLVPAALALVVTEGVAIVYLLWKK